MGRRRRVTLSRSTTPKRPACIFCRSNDGGFNSEEHVFPESLGNTELVLPRGVVCDRCNNGELSHLDQALCDFPALTLRRTMLGIPSKSGKVPVARMSKFTMTHMPGSNGQDPTLEFNSKGPGHTIRESGMLPDGRVALEWSGSGGRRVSPRYASEVSRALMKATFECVWLDNPRLATNARLRHIREAVLGKPYDGFLAIARTADPNRTSATLRYFVNDEANGTTRLWIEADLFGVRMFTDSRRASPRGFDPAMPMQLFAFTKEDSGRRHGLAHHAILSQVDSDGNVPQRPTGTCR